MLRSTLTRTVLLVCVILLESTGATLVLSPVWAESERAGYGPASPGLSSSPVRLRFEPDDAVWSPLGSAFDLQHVWMRTDLRVRPEWRNDVCFGGGPPIAGACNSLDQFGSGTGAHSGRHAGDFFIQQWARIGLGYDPSPNLNFMSSYKTPPRGGGMATPPEGIKGVTRALITVGSS